MPSESRDTIIIRVKSSVKRAARRGAKADNINLTEHIVNLILRDDAARRAMEERQ